MNTTGKCSCGADKKETKQFCDPCWVALPSKTQGNLIGCGNQYATAKAKLQDAIESAEFILRLQRRGQL